MLRLSCIRYNRWKELNLLQSNPDFLQRSPWLIKLSPNQSTITQWSLICGWNRSALAVTELLSTK